MSKLKLNITMSIDGFVAGPNQSVDVPLGVGGEELHDWLVPLKAFRESHGEEGGEVNASTPFAEDILGSAGATIMGRNMFGGGPGPWRTSHGGATGGDNPPYHHPVFVLTSHPREPLQMHGGTTFHFVTDGIESALEQARAPRVRRRWLSPVEPVAQQYLAAGLIDEIVVSIVPILLGGGARLFDNVGDAKLEQVEAVEAPRRDSHQVRPHLGRLRSRRVEPSKLAWQTRCHVRRSMELVATRRRSPRAPCERLRPERPLLRHRPHAAPHPLLVGKTPRPSV